MNTKMWRELEQKLLELGAGYKVDVDNHLGIPEMVIHIDTIGVLLTEEKGVDKCWTKENFVSAQR